MHAYLISGGSKGKRLEEIAKLLRSWKTGKFDQIALLPEGSALTIAQVRALTSRLELVPYQSHFSVALIYDAHLLTPQAQGALLKTLEEPPVHAKLILETENAAQLLPTIGSRCQVIDLGTGESLTVEVQLQTLKEIKHLFLARAGQCLAAIESLIKNREEAAIWINNAITALHQLLLIQYEGETANKEQFTFYIDLPSAKLIRQLLVAQAQLSVNVNPKLALDHVFLDQLIV